MDFSRRSFVQTTACAAVLAATGLPARAPVRRLHRQHVRRLVGRMPGASKSCRHSPPRSARPSTCPKICRNGRSGPWVVSKAIRFDREETPAATPARTDPWERTI